jgi:hypothetical protein
MITMAYVDKLEEPHYHMVGHGDKSHGRCNQEDCGFSVSMDTEDEVHQRMTRHVMNAHPVVG